MGHVQVARYQFSMTERKPKRKTVAGLGRGWDSRWEVTWGHKRDGKAVSQHGSAFLGKGQQKMLKPWLSRDSNPKCGEGTAGIKPQSQQRWAAGIQAYLGLLLKQLDPCSGRVLGSRYWWN